mgnify:CR=1 FL=1
MHLKIGTKVLKNPWNGYISVRNTAKRYFALLLHANIFFRALHQVNEL